MRDPSKVATAIATVMIKTEIINGSIYNLRKKASSLQDMDPVITDSFWRYCYKKIDPYLR